MLRLLREFGPLTRSELGELSGLSRTTLYEVVSRLVDSGQVIAAVPDSTRRGRGRPAEKLIPNPEAGRVLGIDFGRRAVRVVAVAGDRDDLEHQDAISTASEAHSPTAQWPDRIVIARRLVGTLTGGRLRLDALNAVGVAVTGPATDARAPLDRRAMAVMMGRSLGTRVRIDNAARLAALAETVWGAAHGQRDVLYLELSDPVGGALVSGGVLHRGAHGRSGEFGHITAEPGGAKCPCGGRGCLQTVASTTAMLDAYRPGADLPDLLAALGSGDPAAHAVLRRAGTYVGRVLAGLVNALEPGIVVVGGELVTAGPTLLESVRRELLANVVRCGSRPSPLVRPAELGDHAAALGAASLLRQPGRDPSHSAGKGLDTGVRISGGLRAN
ncbi:ROK family transcriptional regulator [Streptomyces chartreusis]|uniref:ROK family transcriptional regulator n=1 Tax=Streptomyces chartreusis TaxID=1969 RepID=UPI00123CDA54|nr:ROK family transcriptional regulator [Streptomyces chartreusis]QEV73060.1 ROK family transcriptional regulator [Streptomyces chartreusis]